jgi:TonB family protein
MSARLLGVSPVNIKPFVCGLFLLLLFAGVANVHWVRAAGGSGTPASESKDDPSGPKIYKIGGDGTPPIPIDKSDPAVNGRVKHAKRKGIVLLSIVITAEGSVNSVEVLNGSDKPFAEKMVETAKKWKFKPATKSGVPVWCKVMMQVQVTKKSAGSAER